MEKDQDLQRFFNELKQKDLELEVPKLAVLPKPKANMTPLWLTIGIAASLLLFAPLIWPEENKIEMPTDVTIISLQETADQEQQFTIQQTTYLDIWESPTASLLTDY